MAVRQLTPADEPAFQRLLRAVYGETYAYRFLYDPGGLTGLLQSGRYTCFGDFSDDGELQGHTAFIRKDPHGEYLESGMSFRRPFLRGGPPTPDGLTWPMLCAWAAERCTFVHQNTSTWHPLAQRFALQHMAARPTGLVVDYVVGERLTALAHPDGPMQALTMSSRVQPDSRRDRPPPLLPDGPWADWLEPLLAAWGPPPDRRHTAAETEDFLLEALELNPALGLQRRVLSRQRTAAPLQAQLASSRARVDLIHLPCDGRVAAFGPLLRAGYLPVGIRPHAMRPDELVLQYLPPEERPGALDRLRQARLYGPARELFAQWMALCTATL